MYKIIGHWFTLICILIYNGKVPLIKIKFVLFYFHTLFYTRCTQEKFRYGGRKMVGILFSILAGVFVGLQGVFNTRVSDKIGLLESTTVVHGVGFVFALIITLMYGSGSFGKIGEINKLYLLGGVFGVIIVFSVIKGISLLGAGFSVAVMLVAQLIIATIIDTFGLFGSPQIKFEYTKILGLLFMIFGIILFKLKG